MRIRLQALLCFALLLITATAQAQPSQLQLVLDDMSRYLGRTVSVRDFVEWHYTVNRYTDSALGCASVSGNSIPEGINGYTFTFVGNGVTYDWRISEDGSIVFPCDAGMIQQSTTQPTLLPATALPPRVTPAPCPPNYAGYLPPRLQVGAQARIEPGGTPNRLRQTPEISGIQIGLMNPGTLADVIGGPSCDPISQIIWWQVRINNVVGWTAEGVLPDDYFVDPVGNQPTTPVPANASVFLVERSAITPTNISDLVITAALPLPFVRDIEFTTDQSLVAFASSEGALVYNLPTLLEEPTLTHRPESVASVAFSPDGRYFAYGTTSNVINVIDNEADGQVTQLDDPPTESLNYLVFSPDDSYRLAVASGDTISILGEQAVGLYDVPNNRLITRFSANFWVNGIAFNSEGTQFAWLDRSLHVHDLESDSEILNVPLQMPLLGAVAYTPDDSAIAYTDQSTIVLISPDEPEERRVYEAVDGLIPGKMTFSPDGSLLAVASIPGEGSPGGASVLSIFDVETGDVIIEQELESLWSLAFSPDGTILVIAQANDVIFMTVP